MNVTVKACLYFLCICLCLSSCTFQPEEAKPCKTNSQCNVDGYYCIDLTCTKEEDIPRVTCQSQSYCVTTFAGGFESGSTNGSRLKARFNTPYFLLFGKDGSLYVSERAGNRIRKIDPSGNVTTFAGSFSGFKNGKRTDARFRYPAGMVFDSKGNMFVADSNNHVIRKIDPAGNVTTFAGSTRGHRDGVGTRAQFYIPLSLAIDKDDNLYVSDMFNNKIKMIDPSGKVDTIAGGAKGFRDGLGTTALFDAPTGLAFDQDGNLYIADGYNNRIRKMDRSRNVTTIAGSKEGYRYGKGTAASFNFPFALAFDKAGSLYVADGNNHRIRKIDSSGNVTTIVGGKVVDGIVRGFIDGPLGTARISAPAGLAFDKEGQLYVADLGNHRIRKITVNINAGKKSVGELCSTKGECQSGLICVRDQATGKSYCVEDCTNSKQCMFGGSCHYKTTKNHLFCACSSYSQCKSRKCIKVFNKNQYGYCQPEIQKTP